MPLISQARKIRAITHTCFQNTLFHTTDHYLAWKTHNLNIGLAPLIISLRTSCPIAKLHQYRVLFIQILPHTSTSNKALPLEKLHLWGGNTNHPGKTQVSPQQKYGPHDFSYVYNLGSFFIHYLLVTLPGCLDLFLQISSYTVLWSYNFLKFINAFLSLKNNMKVTKIFSMM